MVVSNHNYTSNRVIYSSIFWAFLSSLASIIKIKIYECIIYYIYAFKYGLLNNLYHLKWW
jgi:hypothetical protein